MLFAIVFTSSIMLSLAGIFWAVYSSNAPKKEKPNEPSIDPILALTVANGLLEETQAKASLSRAEVEGKVKEAVNLLFGVCNKLSRQSTFVDTKKGSVHIFIGDDIMRSVSLASKNIYSYSRLDHKDEFNEDMTKLVDFLEVLEVVAKQLSEEASNHAKKLTKSIKLAESIEVQAGVAKRLKRDMVIPLAE